MGEDMKNATTDILRRFRTLRVINATGTVTRLGGSLIHPEVIAAMAEAAQSSVDIGALQGYASEVISAHTGAEAGIVTCGAMAGLLVGAAACMTRMDLQKMSQLPDTTGMRNEFIIARSHRNSFDRGVRAAGARLMEVGLPDRFNGCGPRDTEVWEFESAISERTAGVLYLAREGSRPDLASVVRLAHRAEIPVLVDAAAELPPSRNLRRFIEEGADLVVFSGGKALGGPSGSGILCGRRDLVGSAFLQSIDMGGYSDWQPPAQLIDTGTLRGLPRHGIGRAGKVGKESIVGLLAALTRFVHEDEGSKSQRLKSIAAVLTDALGDVPGIKATLVEVPGYAGQFRVEVAVTTGTRASSASELAARLRNNATPVHVEATNADKGVLTLSPTCLSSEDVVIIRAAFERALR